MIVQSFERFFFFERGGEEEDFLFNLSIIIFFLSILIFVLCFSILCLGRSIWICSSWLDPMVQDGQQISDLLGRTRLNSVSRNPINRIELCLEKLKSRSMGGGWPLISNYCAITNGIIRAVRIHRCGDEGRLGRPSDSLSLHWCTCVYLLDYLSRFV